jgi:hypothetical protein
MSSRPVGLATGAPENEESASIGRLVAWTFGLAPVVLILLTWGEDLSILQQLTRGYAFPILAAELAIVSYPSGRDSGLVPRSRCPSSCWLRWASSLGQLRRPQQAL